MKTNCQSLWFLILSLFFSYQVYTQEYFQKFEKITHFTGSDTITSFNFNPVLSSKDITTLTKEQKGKFKKAGSMFVVFESLHEQEVPVIEMRDSKNSITISNKHVVLSDGIENKVAPFYGSILSYQFTRDSYGRKNNTLTIHEDFLSQEGKLLEFLYVPELISPLDKVKIESYLSLKYAISLYKSSYISSSNDTIWNLADHSNFSHRLTGIGRDDGFGLYQSKSRNSEMNGICIGIDSTQILTDQSFLLWSDNASSSLIEKGALLKRKWKFNFYGATDVFRTIRIEVDPTTLFDSYDNELETTDAILWLVLSSTPNFEIGAKYIKYTKNEDSKYIFDELNIYDYGYFTFFIGPEFFVATEMISTLCEPTNQIMVRPTGGEAPYTLVISSENYTQELQFTTSEYALSNIQPGTYQLSFTDNRGNSYSSSTIVTKNSLLSVALKDTWVLPDTNEIIIFPEVSLSNDTVFFEWLRDNEVVGTASTLKTNVAGSYTLKVSTLQGCEKIVAFKVVSSDLMTNQLTIYPNATTPGSPFYIDFNLSEPKDVSVLIHDMSGKEILNKKLGLLQYFNYSTIIETSGTYLLTVNTDKSSVVQRILVK